MDASLSAPKAYSEITRTSIQEGGVHNNEASILTRKYVIFSPSQFPSGLWKK